MGQEAATELPDAFIIASQATLDFAWSEQFHERNPELHDLSNSSQRSLFWESCNQPGPGPFPTLYLFFQEWKGLERWRFRCELRTMHIQWIVKGYGYISVPGSVCAFGFISLPAHAPAWVSVSTFCDQCLTSTPPPKCIPGFWVWILICVHVSWTCKAGVQKLQESQVPQSFQIY